MKMAFTVYSHMFHMLRAQAVYNVVHLFLVLLKFTPHFKYLICYQNCNIMVTCHKMTLNKMGLIVNMS